MQILNITTFKITNTTLFILKQFILLKINYNKIIAHHF